MKFLTRLGISKNVFVMGLVSFFNDFAAEMIYPVVPIFLSTTLGAPVSIIGVIEGIAESTSSILKMVFGWVSDKSKKRKPFVVWGYVFGTVSKGLLGLATSWSVVLFSRFIDRFGKGARTSARDTLIRESTATKDLGKSFGFHRSLDSLGAVVGPLVAIVLLKILDNNYRLIFSLAVIPGLIGVLLLVFFVKEKRKSLEKKEIPSFKWSEMNRSYKIFLFIVVIFSIGNSSDAFLILRAQDLGLSVTLTILAYTLFNLFHTLFATPAGIISDKLGQRKVLFSGFVLFAVVYFLFGFVSESRWVWVLFPLYGMYIAQTEGVSKAYIANLVVSERLGTAYGIYQLALGLTAFGASFVAGLLWSNVSPSAPFYFGSAMAAVAAVMFFVLEKRMRNSHVSAVQG